jgi:hypothetical protein
MSVFPLVEPYLEIPRLKMGRVEKFRDRCEVFHVGSRALYGQRIKTVAILILRPLIGRLCKCYECFRVRGKQYEWDNTLRLAPSRF